MICIKIRIELYNHPMNESFNKKSRLDMNPNRLFLNPVKSGSTW